MHRPSVVILSTAHPAGDGRIRRWVDGFDALGADVRVVAIGTAEFAAGVDLRSLTAATRFNRIGRAMRLPATEAADVVVALDPELYLPALIAQRARGKRVVADVHEDFVALAADADRMGSALMRRVVGAGARTVVGLAARSDATVVADHHVPPTTARRRLVGRNVAIVDDYDLSVPKHDQLHAVYAGDLTPQRGLDAMLEAMAQSPLWRLDLYGPDRPWARDAIAQATATTDGRVRYRGLVSQRELADALPRYHVGLSLLHRIPAYAASMPSKIHEYQAAGLVTITSDLKRVAQVTRDADSGFVLDGDDNWPAQVSSLLALLADDRDRMTKLQHNARVGAESADDSDTLAAAVRALANLLPTER